METEDSSSDVILDTNSSHIDLHNRLLDKVVSSKNVLYKSQQLGDPELKDDEKRKIAEDTLNQSLSLFLFKFGKYLSYEHLDYFNNPSDAERYEVEYYVQLLKKSLKKDASQTRIKNRRFNALQKLITKGSYFSETEMRKRNPLLYEQLVGQFLSSDERRMREDIDTTDVTVVNLLMEQIEREDLMKLKKMQEEDENSVLEEEDTSDEESEKQTNIVVAQELKNKSTKDSRVVLWGEMANNKEDAPIGKEDWIRSNCILNEDASFNEISEAEKKLLLDEFRSFMYSSFLEGKDTDFDYSEVDYNPEHDDLETLNQDEEEKYFDSESPEEAPMTDVAMSEEEDEFEKFMNEIRNEVKTDQITSGLKQLNGF